MITVPETTPDDETTAEDERDARAAHTADRSPTPDEEKAADANPPVSSETAEAYEEAIERGAAVKGEGQIDPS
jgi:hypothetical protein